jgi:predicted membrane-bound dolichyl-phosphate-mannose-protein mannosyltransferase
MKKQQLALILIMLVSLVLRLINLNYPQEYYFDENYTAFTAVNLARHNTPLIWIPAQKPIDPPRGYEWSHPPLARLLIASVINVFGNHAWVWRLPSAIAGMLSILLIYLIGKSLFSSQVGLIASYLIAFDGLSFALTRIATRDALLVLFLLISIHLAYRNRLLLSTLVAGLAIATKWIAVFVLPLLLIYNRLSQKKQAPLTQKVILISTLPILVYSITYLPYFYLGFSFIDFLSLQKNMFTHMFFHGFISLKTHPFSSPWWQWLIGFKPILYYSSQQKSLWAIPNFPTFWLGLITLIITVRKTVLKTGSLIYKNLKTKLTKNLSTLLLSYFTFLSPWILLHLVSGNTNTSYLYYYLPSLPFLHLNSAFWLSILLSKKGIPKTLAFSIILITPLIFFTLYPKLVGL